MGYFVVAKFLLTSASRGPSAIAEFLVTIVALYGRYCIADDQSDLLFPIS